MVLKQVICIPSLAEPVVLQSTDSDIIAVVDTVVGAVVTFAGTSWGNQVSSAAAQINVLPGSISGNVASSFSVPSASVYIVITSSSLIPSFLLAVIQIMRNYKVGCH